MTQPSRDRPDSIVIAASILGADPLRLGEALKACESAGGIEWVQVDVMDGHFTPNLSFGPGTVAGIAKESKLFIDVHLMVSRPAGVLEAFAKAGAKLLTVHAEAQDSPRECLKTIKTLGLKAGLALKPGTPVEAALPCLDILDLLLIMTVEPGFAGQKFIAGSGRKISRAKKLLEEKAPRARWLQVDGGIGPDTIPEVVRAGANVLVAGSSLFKEPPSVTAPRLRKAISESLRMSPIENVE